jgi:hypothetical protein
VPSAAIATQVDDRMICYTLQGFCETVNPTWYDESRNLWCPGSTTTTTSPATTITNVQGRASSGAPGEVASVAPAQLTEVRASRGGSAYVLPPDVLSVQGESGRQTVTVTVRATKRGARTVTFTLRTRGDRPIEIPSSLSKRGYRLSIFVGGVQMLVIPATR